VHEYLLCQVERQIGLIGSKWRLQRNSSIAREQGLQPDLLVLEPDGERIIIEVCCSNFEYDAKNILAEMEIPVVDQIVTVTPDKRTKRLLEQAIEKNSRGSGRSTQESIKLLDASQCLAVKFDWASVLINKSQKMLKFNRES
jgi:hypothetical protein